MRIPLLNLLKKRVQTQIALLQDELVELVYSLDNTLVLHGGTAIWRCYQGNRFSEDLDFYAKNARKLEENFKAKASERGLTLLKFKKTENLIFCKVTDGNVEVRLEINFSARVKPIVARYERADGSFIDVLSLSPEDLLVEKARAYANRKFIRDIYDVYHLTAYATNRDKVRPVVRTLLAAIQPPVDEKNLKTIVYSGAVPTFKQITESLKRRFE